MHRVIFIFFCSIALAYAFPFYGNLSEIRWKTAGSEHFHFHYPAEYTSHAEKVAAVAEAVYDSVTSRYLVPLPSNVHLSLQNALYSNGQAIPAENSMHLWLTNWDFKTRSSHGWLTDVVTHEFSHLVSIESGSKIIPSLYGVQISYTDYYNERIREDAITLLPFTLQPLWLAEGTAQFESERMGFDFFDTHRDMLLRTAVLSDSLLPLEYMHSFSDNSLKAELGPYTQGFSLVRYLAKHYGEDIVPKIWHEFSKPQRVTLDGALKKVIGIGEDSLYSLWKKELQSHYQAQKENLGELVEGTKLTTDAFYHDFPVVSDGYLYGISNFGGKWFDGSVFKLRKNLDSLEIPEDKDEPMLLSFEGTIDIREYADKSFKPKKLWADKGITVKNIENKGPLLAYVSYQNKNRHGRSSFDIFLADTLGNNQEITHLTDAIYPEFHPNGKEILFVRREATSTRFVLSKASIQENPNAKAIDYQDVWAPPESLAYYNIYMPKYSPNGKSIVFSFFDDETRGIATIQENGNDFKIISEKGIDARDPTWLDNETIVYSANKNGIFNLFKKHLPTGKEEPLTNVLGGAFNAVVDSNKIFYIGYDADGFSLYRLNLPKATNVTITKTDTVWTSCATIPFLPQKENLFLALFKKDSSNQTHCLPQAKTISTDSIIEQNTSIVLKGSPLTRPQKEVPIFEDVSFAGSERNYKPIPTIPLWVPMLSFEERSPDFSVLGDGSLLAKIGVAMILSDPLKKNTLQAGLLFEITNGFDFINGSGINPDKQYDFFALLENKSFPVTLQLGYTFTNITSKDTVRYEDPRSYGDSIGVSNYAIPLHNIFAGAGYSLFKKGDTLAVSMGYDWARFNLYEDDFDWTYQKRFSINALFGIFGSFPEEGSNVSGLGNGLALSYRYSDASLFRSGTFSETFVVNANGTISPVYRDFNLHEIGFSAYGSISNPIHKNARLALGASITGILDWSAEKTSDTLDSYYHHPLLLQGYPYLISTESYNRSGTKTATAEIHYLFPIYHDFRNRFWIFETKDFYVDIFAQVGAAWDSKWFDTDKFKSRDFWDRSVGIEFRLANTLFYSIPFDISLNIARGLDRIGENAEGKGGQKMNPIDVPLLPKSISPTRIHFSIGTGFRNTWQNE